MNTPYRGRRRPGALSRWRPPCAFCLGAVLGVAAAPPAQAVDTGDIAGTVTAQVGGAHLADISVNVYASLDDYYSGNQAASTQTVANGAYDFGGSLPAGSYLVEFRDDSSGNYLTQYYDAQSTIDSADPVAVTGGNTTDNIDAALAPAAHITGTVSKQGGGTLANIHVSASVADDQGGWNSLSDTQTAGNGTYDLGGLPAGSYRIQFQDDAGNYVQQWYDNKPDPDSAANVTATVGAAHVEHQRRARAPRGSHHRHGHRRRRHAGQHPRQRLGIRRPGQLELASATPRPRATAPTTSAACPPAATASSSRTMPATTSSSGTTTSPMSTRPPT